MTRHYTPKKYNKSNVNMYLSIQPLILSIKEIINDFNNQLIKGSEIQ